MLVPPFIAISRPPISSTHGAERLPRGSGCRRRSHFDMVSWWKMRGSPERRCQHGQPASRSITLLRSEHRACAELFSGGGGFALRVPQPDGEMVKRGRKTSRIGAGDSGSLIWTRTHKPAALSCTFQREAAPMGLGLNNDIMGSLGRYSSVEEGRPKLGCWPASG